MLCRALPCGCCGCVATSHRPECPVGAAPLTSPDVPGHRERAAEAVRQWWGKRAAEELPGYGHLVSEVAMAIDDAVREAVETTEDAAQAEKPVSFDVQG